MAWFRSVVPVVSGVALVTTLWACSDAGKGVSPSTVGDGGLAPTATAGDGGATDPRSACKLNVPSSYDGAAFATNAATELSLRKSLQAFTQPMKDAEANLDVTPKAADLRALFELREGERPSLRDITSPYYAQKIEGYLEAFAQAAGKSWTPSEPPQGVGGRYGAYLFTERGTDLRQAIEKGLFGAGFYLHAARILEGPLTEGSVDRLLAIYGAHPSFPRNDKGPNEAGGVPHPDTLVALYAKRRDPDDKDAPGLYRLIQSDLLTLRAAIAGGDDCASLRLEAGKSFKRHWEQTLFATALFYLNDAQKKLAKGDPTPQELASALHGYGEAVGFIHGFRTLPLAHRIATDADIDDVLTVLGAPPNGPATSYRFVTDGAAELPKFANAMARIAKIQGFSPRDVERFKANH